MAEQRMQETAGKAIPAGYKLTEVGIIPEDWVVISIQNSLTEKYILDQMDGNHGQLYPKSHEFSSFGVPYIGATDFSNGDVDFKGCKFLPLERAKKFKKGIARNGDVLFAHNATVGPVCLLESDFDFVILSTTATYYRCNNDLLKNKYLAKYFCSDFFVSQYKAVMSQSTRNQVPILAQRKFLIVVPSKDEQTAIANVLSDSDALIDALEQLIAKKQAIKSATMQQLLTGRTRLPAFALRPDGTPKGYKPSELGEIPEDWEAQKMGGVAQIQRGASPRPIDSPVWFDRNSSVGWLRISDVTKTVKYLFDTTQSLSEMGVAHSRFVSSNNLVMSICATVGKPIITKKDLCIHDGFVVFHGLTVNQDYMYYVLKDLEDEWGKQGQTGSQMNLNTDLINGTLIALPREIEEQTAIATILSDMDNELQALTQKLEKARALKQGMMQQLLTGKIRLPLATGA